MKKLFFVNIVSSLIFFLSITPALSASEAFKDNIYNPGHLKPVDSTLKVKVGDLAPDFTLPSVSGEKISLSQYRGKKHVVISFVPAAWTPVCSDQWPGYNIVKQMFTRWGTCGFRYFQIFGRTARWLKNMAYYGPVVLRNGH
jgi:hypothetical protein